MNCRFGDFRSRRRELRSRALALLVAVAAAGCAGTPNIEGAPGAPPAPNTYWTPPASVRVPAAETAAPTTQTPFAPAMSDSALRQLSLADAVDLALRNNPTTRISWAKARATADLYGASKGAYYPDLSLSGTATRSRSIAVPGRLAGERTQYGPTLNLSYLLFDFGGRKGATEAARQVAIAADLAHNTAVQNTVLEVETSVFSYLATRALRNAQRTALDEATANLAAATDRHNVGLATIADVLQARTAQSQARLDLETLDGQLSIARGALAAAMGLPANTALDLPEEPPTDSTQIDTVGTSVDSLIALATRNRPELMAAQAQAREAQAELTQAKSSGLPSLAFTGNAGHMDSDLDGFAGNSYTLTFGISVPLFSGFSNTYNVHAAREQLGAAQAQIEQTRQQIALQVFTSYYGLRTTGQRVCTSADLLASATESEQVARGRYTEGVGSILDLLVAQSALASARAQAVQTGWQWRIALAQLAHDVGLLGIHGESLAPLTTSTSRLDR